MKKISIITVAVVVALSAQADYLLNFRALFGYSSDSDATGNTGLLLNAGDQATVQLIYAAGDGADYNSQFDNGTGTTFVLNGVTVAGNDQLITSFLTTAYGGTPLTDFTEFAGFTASVQESFLGADIYARIFDAAGGKFYQTAVFTASDIAPPASPQIFEADGVDAPVFAGLQSNGDVYQVVPEPATFGLLGVAALGLFLARKKARR